MESKALKPLALYQQDNESRIQVSSPDSQITVHFLKEHCLY